MGELAQAILSGSTAFAATNIDDIVILTLLFAQVNATFRPRHIVFGQYLGFALLVLASLPGFFGGLIVPKAWIGLLGFLPIAIGVSQLLQPEEQPQVQTVTALPSTPKSWGWLCTRLLSPQIYSVAAITLANGGDNIGVYLPLFANSSVTELIIILVTFLVLIAAWCYIAYRLTKQFVLTRLLTRYSHRIVPLVLISLGIFILIESHIYR
ncbi:MAG: cadmium resistance transporter [Oscillatoriophycideae cyanobacterium NC_groundwater_1537_Pr4_S-0.65um_50_18]|nr:cadmium resistance transporter [Oscillatoriophycideae cyanobacterium NC_groundwater_1537_Pr4_S-0.65um_50_18]